MNLPGYRIVTAGQMHRRSFLVTGSLSAAALWAQRANGAVVTQPKFSDYPFKLGVASGDPAPDGFVLWTRLAPKPLDGGGISDAAVEVAWQVAEDEQMKQVVQRGTTVAKADWAHSVHVEIAGLRPGRWYWYQFKAGKETSPIGRTRTAPALDAMPSDFRFAFASCQHFEHGFYTAYQHMAKQELDMVVHLGDYIYEGKGSPDVPAAAKKRAKREANLKAKNPAVPKVNTGTKIVRAHVGPRLDALEDYRNRHAQYKTDPHLQAMHALAPWLVTWDDHEFENNYANDIPQHIDKYTREAFLAMRSRAYQAYYEHMPLRRASLPKGPDMLLHRKVTIGRLAEFFVLDTRQYRTNQPNGDGHRPPSKEQLDPSATLLGNLQRDWLFHGLQTSKACWNVLAQQVMMARVDRKAGDAEAFSMDQWPGYEADRQRVLKFLQESKIANPVVLTGDIHSNWANELTLGEKDKPQTVAAEFVGTSISSGGNGQVAPKALSDLLSENPSVKFHNTERGFVQCQLGDKQWRTDYQTVPFVDKPDAPLVTRASYVLEAGSSKLHTA